MFWELYIFKKRQPAYKYLEKTWHDICKYLLYMAYWTLFYLQKEILHTFMNELVWSYWIIILVTAKWNGWKCVYKSRLEGKQMEWFIPIYIINQLSHIAIQEAYQVPYTPRRAKLHTRSITVHTKTQWTSVREQGYTVGYYSMCCCQSTECIHLLPLFFCYMALDVWLLHGTFYYQSQPLAQ